MTGLIYKEIPPQKITHLTRPEFINGQEAKFNNALKKSIKTHGMRDPVFINQLHDGTLKVTVGNNRMVIAKELGLSKIPAICLNYLSSEEIILELWPSSVRESITKSMVIHMCESDDLFPPKTTKHTTIFDLPPIFVSLDELK